MTENLYKEYLNKSTKLEKCLYLYDLYHNDAKSFSELANSYRIEFHPSFNNDIQETGVVALARVLCGINKSDIPYNQLLPSFERVLEISKIISAQIY